MWADMVEVSAAVDQRSASPESPHSTGSRVSFLYFILFALEQIHAWEHGHVDEHRSTNLDASGHTALGLPHMLCAG